MTTTKHTPGPWRIQEHAGEINTQYCIAADPEGEPSRMLAILCGRSRSDFDANAALMTAAPLLLAELEEIARMANEVANGHVHEEYAPLLLGKIRDRARAAIAKARGEAS